MLRTIMKSKLHRATVTDADLNYEGSITIDKNLIEMADLMVNEKVEIYNCNNGARFSTYVIPGGPVKFVSMGQRLAMPTEEMWLLLSLMP